MAPVYKYRISVPLLIIVVMVLFKVAPVTLSASKAYNNIRTAENTGNEKFPYDIILPPNHKVERRRPAAQKTKTLLPKRQPFYYNISVTVRAQTRTNVTLHCNVSGITDKENVTFIWSKKNDKNSQSNNITTFVHSLDEEAPNRTLLWGIDDKRFLARREDTDWCLYIRYLTIADAGMYQCQICQNSSSTKCFTTNVNLRLIDAFANIIGGPEKFIPSDKELPLRLSCVLIYSIEPPTYIFWYHGDRMINYDLEDGATVREGPQGSELIFPKPNKTHVGNYSCVPSNALQDSVMVYYGDESVYLEGNCGGKTHPGDRVFNMLVLMSTFHLTR